MAQSHRAHCRLNCAANQPAQSLPPTRSHSVPHRPRINSPSCCPDTLWSPSSLPWCSQSRVSVLRSRRVDGRWSLQGLTHPKHLTMRQHGVQVFGAEEKVVKHKENTHKCVGHKSNVQTEHTKQTSISFSAENDRSEERNVSL